jgi:hypothetical protein
MAGHGEKFGRKQEEAIAALLSQRNIDEAARVAALEPERSSAGSNCRNSRRRITKLGGQRLGSPSPGSSRPLAQPFRRC